MRQRLLEAALAILKQRGLAGFRTADVIERAGVSKGALLHHFPTKVGLIVAVFEGLYDAEEAKARPSKRRTTLVETLSDLISDSHAFFFGESFSVTLDITISGARDPELRDAIFGSVRGFRKRAELAWAERLMAFGVSRDRAYDAVRMVNGTVRGLAVRTLWETDLPLSRRLEHDMAEMLAEYLSK
ncbi:TetR/AcrR family transcriptional regulator [Sphingobium sp. SCG-1]|uniref:TetR/AcrR family transcriptional regulator n=1 Tax=Sphingobium sp. SCG-1 TaxID=2072936 RepID=UPI001CB911AE|nr:TetR/AcrR family transcriptional regulator [Sphingobium sp. SCG-1]